MSVQRTCCCVDTGCALFSSCDDSGDASPDVLQFSCTSGDPAARGFFNPPSGIVLDTSSAAVTFVSGSAARNAANNGTIVEWEVLVELDYQAGTTYPGGFETDCRCDSNGTYSSIPAWSGIIEWTGTLQLICLDGSESSATFDWAQNSSGVPTPPRYDLNQDIGSACGAGVTLDPPNPAITIDLKLTQPSVIWDVGATSCSDLLTKYRDATFEFELQQNGGCSTTTYGTAAEMTIRFGWS